MTEYNMFYTDNLIISPVIGKNSYYYKEHLLF